MCAVRGGRFDHSLHIWMAAAAGVVRNDLPTLLEKGYGLGLAGIYRALMVSVLLLSVHEIHLAVACPRQTSEIFRKGAEMRNGDGRNYQFSAFM